jgi:hypothetical protein
MIIRGSMGLGDAIYLYPVVKYFIDYGHDVTIVTRYPEIFEKLNCKTLPEKAEIGKDFLDCSCSFRTTIPGTNIFEDTLIMAGIKEKLPLKIEYDTTKKPKYPTSKKVCVVRTPTAPVKGEEETRVMIPNMSVFQTIINAFHDRVYFVLLGRAINCDENLSGVDLDLSGVDGVKNVIGAIDGADLVLTQPGHFVPLAEVLEKKLFTVFARAGLQSQEKRFRFTTPAKILTCRGSVWCVDDDPEKSYLEKFERLING